MRQLTYGKPLPPLALRYAAALYDLANERSQLTSVEGDITGFKKMLDETPQLAAILANPLSPRKAISAALEKIFEAAKFTGLARHFFHVTVANGRASAIPVILTAFLARVAEARGIVTADVVTAHALSDAQNAELRTALTAALQKQGVKDVVLNARVDNSVLGGVQVQVGAWMYDGTLKSRLQTMGQYLKGAQ